MESAHAVGPMSQQPPAPVQPTVAYIGLSHPDAEEYLASLEDLPVAVTCALEPDVDREADDRTRLPDTPIYTSLETLLAEESPDIAWVSVSNRRGPGVLKRVLGEGLDVYVAAPVARSATELAPIAQTVERTDATVATGYIWRANPVAKELRRRVQGGFFGGLNTVTARLFASSLTHRSTEHYLYDREESRGGAGQRLGIHWLDLITWITGERLTSVSARMTSDPAVDVDTQATIAFETASGAIGTLQCGYGLRAERYESELCLRGDAGQGWWTRMHGTDPFGGATTLTLDSEERKAPRTRTTYEYANTRGYGGGWGRAFMQNFLDARSADTALIAGIDEALASLRVLDAVYDAADTGRWETVPAEDETANEP